MKRFWWAVVCLWAGTGGWVALWPGTAGAGAAKLKVSFDFPPADVTWDRPCSTAVVAGMVRVRGEKLIFYDVVLALDTSGSTVLPAGGDINGNGVVGEIRKTRSSYALNDTLYFTDPGDSILAAEVEGARRLLRLLDPSSTRVALVSFSGDIGSPLQHTDLTVPDAFVQRSLTLDYGQIRESLHRLQAREPAGGTNMAAAIRTGIEELLGLSETDGLPRAEAQRLILLLTDGKPTFPVGSSGLSDSEDKMLTVSAAHVALEAGIRVYTYVMGIHGLSDPFAMKEVARVSGGKYIPVPHPADIVGLLEQVRFIDLRSLEVANATLARSALNLLLSPEGYFIATVPIAKGVNEIAATAVASDGTQAGSSIYLNCLGDRGEELALDLTRESLSDLKVTLKKEEERLLRLAPFQRDLILTPEPKRGQEGLELELEPIPEK